MLLLLLACTSSKDIPSPTASFTATGDQLALQAPGYGAITLQARAEGDGTLTVTFSERERASDDQHGVVDVTVTAGDDGATLRAVVLEGAWVLEGDEDPVWWRQGFQSWSKSAVVPYTPATPGPDGWIVAGGKQGDALAPAQETAGTSWWVGLIGRPDGASALLGALHATTTTFSLGLLPEADANAGGLQAIYGGQDGEALSLAPGEALSLAPLYLALGDDPYALHTGYADAVAATTPPRPAGQFGSTPPVGWSDWSLYYGSADEAAILTALENASVLPTDLPEDLAEGRRVFQVDDGWEPTWGDWRFRDTFPSGGAALASHISAAGFTPGLWMAPFYASVSSEVYTAHPDWWLRDDTGQILLHSSIGADPLAILDVTHPDAARWLQAQLQARVEEGWRYFKLDFLYAAAQEGQRYTPMTGMQAYQRGLSLLREAVGEDAWILGCGAPMLPSVGWVDSYRSGADISYLLHPDPAIGFSRWQAVNTAARAWANGRWWWNDPDALLVRAPLTDAQATAATAAVAVAGGVWFSGDDLSALSTTQRALAYDPAWRALQGQEVVPQAPLESVSGMDASPLLELGQADDTPPPLWIAADGTRVSLDLRDTTAGASRE